MFLNVVICVLFPRELSLVLDGCRAARSDGVSSFFCSLLGIYALRREMIGIQEV